MMKWHMSLGVSVVFIVVVIGLMIALSKTSDPSKTKKIKTAAIVFGIFSALGLAATGVLFKKDM